MRNLFNQYDQPENKLTHALASVLFHEPCLVRPFLKWVGVRNAPRAARLQITEQQIPGELIDIGDGDSSGLPDMAIFDQENWAVLFESKVQSRINIGQLRRHLATAKRHGYSTCASR